MASIFLIREKNLAYSEEPLPKGNVVKLSESVIMPREDFYELQLAAWDHVPTSAKERVATTIQTTTVLTVMAVAFTGAAWGWAKAMNWLNEKDRERLMADLNATPDPK